MIQISMIKYKYPAWYRIHLSDKVLDITDEILKEWRKETKECNDHNKLIYKQIKQKFQQVISLAIEIWGEDSLEVRYLYKKSPQYYFNLNFENDVFNKVNKLRNQKAKEIEKTEVTKKRQELNDEAIAWLLERKYEFGKDFNSETAVEFADESAFEAECNRRIEENTFFSFAGDDNCEDCSGWNGKSHRCDCGNRRVCWTTGLAHSFKEPYVYAEAD